MKKGFVPVWWFTGASSAAVLMDRAAAALVAWGRDRCGPTAFNLTVTFADDAQAGQLATLAETMPMMADLRVIAVQRMDAAPEDLLVALAAYAARPSPSTLLVLVGPSPPVSSRKKDAVDHGAALMTAIRSGKGEVVSFHAGSVSPVEHARTRASELGKRLDPRAAQALVEVVGTDLSVLEREVEKLACYVDGDDIDDRAVAACATFLAEADVWDLTGAIAGRDAARAVVALERLMSDGDAPHRLLAMVNWQVRQVLSCVASLRAGASPDDAARTSGLKRHLVDRLDPSMVRDPNGFDPAAIMDRLATANHAMNSKRVDGQATFEALVLALASR